MPAKKYIICLTPEEREELEQVSRSHRRSAREKMRARILLLCDTSLSREEGASRIDEEIVAQLGCAMPTVFKVRQRALERGAVASLRRQEQQNRKARAKPQGACSGWSGRGPSGGADLLHTARGRLALEPAPAA